MDKDEQERELECQQRHSQQEINTVEDMITRSNFGRVADSSTKNIDSASTSPIFDTKKIRRQANLQRVRKTTGDVASKQNPAESGKPRATECILKLERVDSLCPSTSGNLKKYRDSDKPVARDDDKKNPTSRELISRLRDLKCQQKLAVKVEHLKDARISDEKFVESVTVLDRANKSTPFTVPRESPVKKLGLQPFVSLERSLRVMPNVSPPITHFSLDEVNEDDMFADERDDAEVIDDIVGKFSQWDYKSADDGSSSMFRGFSAEDYNFSNDRATRATQHSRFAETAKDENLISYDSSRFGESRELSAVEVSRVESRPVAEIVAIGKDNVIENVPIKDSRGNSGVFSPPTSKGPETALAKAETALGEQETQEKSNISNSPSEHVSTTSDGRPLVESVCKDWMSKVPETALAKAETALGETQEKSNISNSPSEHVSTTSDGRPLVESVCKGWMNKVPETSLAHMEMEFVESQRTVEVKIPISTSTYGFSTARGCPIVASDAAIAKAKAEWAKVMETIKEEPSADRSDNVKDSVISCKGNKTILDSSQPPRDSETTENSEHREKNASDSSSSLGFTVPHVLPGFSTARGRPIEITDTALNNAKRVYSNLDDRSQPEENSTVPKNKRNREMENECKISCDFKTANGVKIVVSKDSLLKAEHSYETIEEPFIQDSARESVPDARGVGNVESKIKTETITDAKYSVSSGGDKLCPSPDEYYLESLDFEDFLEPMGDPEIPKKRRIEDIDEDTPSMPKKKGRYAYELQVRKLFEEDTSDDEALKPVENIAKSNRGSVGSSHEGSTSKMDAESANDRVSPELEVAAIKRKNDSMRNSIDELDRTQLEKVNVVGGGSKGGSECSNAGSCAVSNTEDTNDGAVVTIQREDAQEIEFESIPDDLAFGTQFSQDIKDSTEIDEFIFEAVKIMKSRLTMISEQDEAIRAKIRTKPEPRDGHLYRLRNENRKSRISWRQLTDDVAPTAREISSKSDIQGVTADSAVHYRFRCADFYGEYLVRRNIEGIKVGDGASLILDEQNCASAHEFERAFLASPNVDPNLVPNGWIKNHYRWIVWKLASIDRSQFGHKCLVRMLTPERVMLELKYRYDREIYRTQWPPLRRILERGEDASARLVLCVASIIPVKRENTRANVVETPTSIGTKTYVMRLTDGWYSIAASVDAAMINFINSGKVREGTKLMISGAKVTNLDQGCSVLEIPETVTLRICSNSTRRVKWDTKLDFYRANRRPMSLSLKSVKPNGGTIGKTIVAVSRVYPMLYREKLSNGTIEFKNARCNEEAEIAHEALCQAKKEEIYANAMREFQMSSSKKRIYPTQEEAYAHSRETEEELRQRILTRMRESLPSPRDVTPVTKIRIAESNTSALVTFWSTKRDTTELFVEGSSIAIYNAYASGSRSNELQITAGRSAFVQREESQRIDYPERILTSLGEVAAPGFNPVYGEFDTIGIVASTGPAPHGMKNFEVVNLACPRADDTGASDFLSILFWLGVSAYGYGKFFTVGSLVACSNLEWRRNTSRGIATAYCSERSIFSKNPRQNHFIQAFENFTHTTKEPLVYASTCAAEIQAEVAKKSALRTPGTGSPYKPMVTTDRIPDWSPRNVSSPLNAGRSTPDTLVSTKLSTKKRLEKLERYGEAPRLPSVVINSSRNISSEFRSPMRTPVSKS